MKFLLPFQSFFWTKKKKQNRENFLQRESEEFDEVTLISKCLSSNYNDLFRGEFQRRPFTCKIVEQDLDDRTFYLRESLVDFCQALCTSIDIRFKKVLAIFATVANCFDIVALYQQVVLDEREDVLQ